MERRKSRTSIKVRDRKRQQAQTGNRPITQEGVTELERRVIAIIGSDYIQGHESVSENVPMEEVCMSLYYNVPIL